MDNNKIENKVEDHFTCHNKGYLLFAFHNIRSDLLYNYAADEYPHLPHSLIKI